MLIVNRYVHLPQWIFGDYSDRQRELVSGLSLDHYPPEDFWKFDFPLAYDRVQRACVSYIQEVTKGIE